MKLEGKRSKPFMDLTAFLTLLSHPSQSIFTLISTVCSKKPQYFFKERKRKKEHIYIACMHCENDRTRNEFGKKFNKRYDILIMPRIDTILGYDPFRHETENDIVLVMLLIIISRWKNKICICKIDSKNY